MAARDTLFAFVRNMTVRSRPPSTHLAATLGAAAVAAVAVAAAIAVKRSAARAGTGVERLLLDALSGRRMRVAELQSMRAGDFHALCAAYYERMRFCLREPRVRGSMRDAVLYFGTLPYPVAILRSIAAGARKVDVADISDLADAMSRYAIGKGIVHATGGYTDAAITFAHTNRIRLVSGDDFGRSMAGTVAPAEAGKSAALQP